ncbi:MAG: hypothetical protein D6758_09060 [Gammaproteobacteria bacterium]|nr:MAG: hypothetical protein D6758_09060 [Gammaproteobacteria bacterium]
MSADSLYDNIRSYLRLTARIVPREGHRVNVGERFTIRFTGTNVAYDDGTSDKPDIVFLNPRIRVLGGRHARPVHGDDWHNLPDTQLFPGESSSIEIEFEAMSEIRGRRADRRNREQVARTQIEADLDLARFFKIRNYADIHHEIYRS